VNNRRVDYHCHLLPGLDDGARHLDDSLAMAQCLVAAGFAVVHCTPHAIRGVYETAPETVREAVAALQAELDRAAIPLKLKPGMEYYLDEYFPQAIETPVPLGDSTLLLVEAPPNAHPLMVQENIFHAVRQGFTPLFAHPERVPFLAPVGVKRGPLTRLRAALTRNRRPQETTTGNARLDMLRQQGCLFQGNIGSFAGYYGREIRKTAQLFQRAGLYDFYGSDGHRPEPLKWCLEKGLQVLQSQAVGHG
jgi:protein-tyrosine phosphatase